MQWHASYAIHTYMHPTKTNTLAHMCTVRHGAANADAYAVADTDTPTRTHTHIPTHTHTHTH